MDEFEQTQDQIGQAKTGEAVDDKGANNARLAARSQLWSDMDRLCLVAADATLVLGLLLKEHHAAAQTKTTAPKMERSRKEAASEAAEVRGMLCQPRRSTIKALPWM